VHGNVWEWVEDCVNDGYAGAPTDGSAWMSGNCNRRVMRGGSWVDYPVGARSAIRSGFGSSGRGKTLGFRVARTLD
jgi:formylglycine-generating enzyme required for sulfatase activity